MRASAPGCIWAVGSGNFGGAGMDALRSAGSVAGIALNIGTIPLRTAWGGLQGFGQVDAATYKDLVSRPLTTAEIAWSKAGYDGQADRRAARLEIDVPIATVTPAAAAALLRRRCLSSPSTSS